MFLDGPLGEPEEMGQQHHLASAGRVGLFFLQGPGVIVNQQVVAIVELHGSIEFGLHQQVLQGTEHASPGQIDEGLFIVLSHHHLHDLLRIGSIFLNEGGLTGSKVHSLDLLLTVGQVVLSFLLHGLIGTDLLGPDPDPLHALGRHLL